jgi:hypothetical protein
MGGIMPHDERLMAADMRRLGAKRRLIDTLFVRLADDTANLQPEIAALRQVRFFGDANRRIDRMMAARILLATLAIRLRALRIDYKLPEDSPRFLLLETVVRALAVDGLRTMAERISSGHIVPPLGSDECLSTWASVLETPDLEEEPSYAATAKVMREAVDRLPTMHGFT